MSHHIWKRLSRTLIGIGSLFAIAPIAFADWEVNMPRGVTDISSEVYDLHMLIFNVCVAIAVVVFGAMIVSIFLHRKSRGAQPAKFTHSTKAEIIWTIIPILILVAMAVPSAETLIKMSDTRNSDLTVKITGYQWKWRYDYLDEGFGFYSTLAQSSNEARQLGSGIDPNSVEHYLRNVDNPLVVPVGAKVRLLLTAADVIHAWWIPDLAVKMDAIPGYVNESWFRVDEPGVFRGQCAELCGRGHGFMPVVVVAKDPVDYAAWVAGQQVDAGIVVAAGSVEVAETPSGEITSVEMVIANPTTGETFEEQTVTAQTGGETVVLDETVATDPRKGLVVAETTVAEIEETAGASLDDLMGDGEKLYLASCAGCHMANGEGVPGAFPALKGNAVVTGDVREHIGVVLNGRPGTAMLAFGPQLDDATLAAIITYQRNAWGNDTGDVVQAADIAAAR